MGRHDSGKMTWKISDITKEIFWMRLRWGGLGLLILAVVLLVLETVGGK